MKTQPIAGDLAQIFNSDHVTRLILLQELYKLGLVDYPPLDDPEFVARVGEGVDGPRGVAAPTGPTSQKNFFDSGAIWRRCVERVPGFAFVVRLDAKKKTPVGR